MAPAGGHRPMVKHLLVVCAVIAFAIHVFASSVPSQVADAMVNRFVESWNRADGASYGENYWPEAELVDPTGAIVTGRSAIVKRKVFKIYPILAVGITSQVDL